jgi:hypothetical protein
MTAILGPDIAGFIEARPFVSSFVAFGLALIIGRSIAAMTHASPPYRRRGHSFSSR